MLVRAGRGSTPGPAVPSQQGPATRNAVGRGSDESDAPVWDRPTFLDLPQRDAKPRTQGVTHVLDKGASVRHVEGLLDVVGEFVDIVKIGWGISYVDPAAKERVALYQGAGAIVCAGGTLLEVAAATGRIAEFRRWAVAVGFDAVEVSNGLSALTIEAKRALVAELCDDFIVLAEAGSKDEGVPVAADEWVSEMVGDLEAGARWVIAEGRESGTVGLYELDGTVRPDLVESLRSRVPQDRVIFETPRKAQQVWFVNEFGAGANLGNIPLDEVLALETLRLGLRADTAHIHVGTDSGS